ncbi:MAG: hypothetical protein C5B49_08125 [Bdellovibrio sp.]|nr:MAG: hypothetical protein C5B49_08125 [Bdellovibrio sp.]
MVQAISRLISFSFLFVSVTIEARLGEKIVPDPAANSTAVAQTTAAAQNTAEAQNKAVARYSVHEKKLSSTVTVKEYAGTDGVVFAVSWRGLARPDLSDLLGDYYSEYSNAEKEQKTQPRRRSAASITTPQIIVKHFGHMRDIRGLAYIKDRIPSSVRVEELE